jgi:alkaline phosphatase D
MNRRDFLRLSGSFIAAAGLAKLPACGDDGGGQPTGVYAFPQGVASGDPRETSVVLWTRAVRADAAAEEIELLLEVSTDAGFATVAVQQTVTAGAAADHTVRVLITGLAADTIYHYRFVAAGDQIVGRTRTAPAADADVPVRLGWVSCQDYGAGHFHAYRLMIEQDEGRADADQIRAIVHLGDFIYEALGAGYQRPLDANLQPTTITNADGSPRQIGPFPSGGGDVGDGKFARTLDDYRHLYKGTASDPDLRAARARWPFIHSWDDHEFTNDSWQSQANYDDRNSVDEAHQTRKLASCQAWFEYMPAHLTGAPGVAGVTQRAHDFAPATVADAPFTPANDDNFVPEPNNVAAVGSLTIYRSLRFGRHVELIVTDQRSYRSDHAIPEEFAEANIEYLDTRNVLPTADLETMDAGRTANGGNPPDAVGISGTPNPRKTAPVGTMLGVQQKQWWKDSMRGSTATWKVWGNQVPFVRFDVKKGPVSGLIVDRLMNGDAWDGYALERTELTTYLRAQAIRNVVLLTGDIHAQLAGVVLDDFRAPAPTPVAVELTAAGVTSNSLFSYYESASRGAIVPADVRSIVTFDATASGGPRFVENLNMLLRFGPAAARTMAQTNDLAMAMAAADGMTNTHLRYADTNAQGYGVALFTGTQVEAALVTIARPLVAATASVLRTATFTVAKDNPGAMAAPTITGTKPFPLT